MTVAQQERALRGMTVRFDKVTDMLHQLPQAFDDSTRYARWLREVRSERHHEVCVGSLPGELVECTANPLAHGVIAGVSGVFNGDKFRAATVKVS
ncbi:MAG TPA: hypothetical protein VE196_07380 [Pseudonocardiaceae bacterium]|nr:hypothetical protein [Pseudonocardiaceae bacterium]